MLQIVLNNIEPITYCSYPMLKKSHVPFIFKILVCSSYKRWREKKMSGNISRNDRLKHYSQHRQKSPEDTFSCITLLKEV